MSWHIAHDLHSRSPPQTGFRSTPTIAWALPQAQSVHRAQAHLVSDAGFVGEVAVLVPAVLGRSTVRVLCSEAGTAIESARGPLGPGDGEGDLQHNHRT